MLPWEQLAAMICLAVPAIHYCSQDVISKGNSMADPVQDTRLLCSSIYLAGGIKDQLRLLQIDLKKQKKNHTKHSHSL